jgi:glycerate 2-kinase
MSLRKDANEIIHSAIRSALPNQTVKKALDGVVFDCEKLLLVSVGKAAWEMAEAAVSALGNRISGGVVITKYGHSKGAIQGLSIFEAGHPVPDANSFQATEYAIDMVKDLAEKDMVLFLLSGGASALFEKPLVAASTMESITKDMLACGADIEEINTIRKRLSWVKGGKFANICAPAGVHTLVLSDVLGDRLDVIASGPAYPDSSTCKQALDIIRKYNIEITEEVRALLKTETPKVLSNVKTQIIGNIHKLCSSAQDKCRQMGYETVVLTQSLTCIAREAGSFLASIAAYHQNVNHSVAFIACGETVVNLTGNGMGGRNQEMALSASVGIDGFKDTAIFSVGSDGTDGPTDAAGGYVDGQTRTKLKQANIDIFETLNRNDSYHALKQCGGLIITGPTGTNVNDLSVILIKR